MEFCDSLHAAAEVQAHASLEEEDDHPGHQPGIVKPGKSANEEKASIHRGWKKFNQESYSMDISFPIDLQSPGLHHECRGSGFWNQESWFQKAK